MIARLLVWTLVALVFHFVWRLLLRATARRRTRPSREPATGRMVRDRMCQTFLPEADALRLEQSGQIHYFCSATCRELFLSGKTSP